MKKLKTNQEIFERVARHLFAQVERSMRKPGRDHSTCAYRGEEGWSCAVDCLMPDEAYQEAAESFGVFGIGCREEYGSAAEAKRQALVQMLAAGVENPFGKVNLLADLQSCYDGKRNWDNTYKMQDALAAIGVSYNLNVDFLHELRFDRQTVPA